MHYPESKAQSSEYLRLALPLMARQAAAHHPVSYTLWYEYVAGINPALSQVLAARLQAEQPLGEDDVYRLHALYIVTRDVEILERLQQKLCTLLEETAQATATAGQDTGVFGQVLEATETRLTGGISLEHLRDLVSELLGETTRMRLNALAVAEKLEARAQEVRELTQQLVQAQSEALLDPLTGLKNRRGFERVVQELASLDERLKGSALLLTDVDHFKHINDTHGHLLGDKVLRAIGHQLHSNLKGRDLAARWGGDEFAVLLRQTTPNGAAVLAEQLRAAVAGGRMHGGDGLEISGAVTLSIGVAVAGEQESFESLLARADRALYAAKGSGRNQVVVGAA